MMDLKLAWRAWSKCDRTQVLALSAIGAALRSGGVALHEGANKGCHLSPWAYRAGSSPVRSNQAGKLKAFVTGRLETPASEFRGQSHLKQAGARFWDATDCDNNFNFRPTGAAS